MSTYTYAPHSLRVSKAKLAESVSPALDRVAWILAIVLIVAGLVIGVIKSHLGFCGAGVGVIIMTFLLWLKWDLRLLPAARLGTTIQLDLLLPASLAAHFNPAQPTSHLWQITAASDEGFFILQRFELDPSSIASQIGAVQLTTEQIWTKAAEQATQLGLSSLTPGLIITAFFALVPPLQGMLSEHQLAIEDLLEGAHWAARFEYYLTIKRPFYGGLARDWASGYTPLLSRYGTNLSQQVEFAGRHISTQERTTQLDTLITDLESTNGSVVLIGEPGIGKTALMLGLADRLLQAKDTRSLRHYQIYALNAAAILSDSKAPGDIESLVSDLFEEALHAGNVIVALDEAQLFFGEGTGAVNLSRLLLPLLQSRRIKMILALTPGDWQKLRATNTAMASLLTSLVMSDPSEKEVLRVLADRALLMEDGRHVTIYLALIETYRLSGRYYQDEAYPGKAIKLLEAAFNHPDGTFISETSVQQAIEGQVGVKVTTASSAESDTLLHLEDKIHERMINQTRAVSVVSNALRRARAGVANPKRPFGSFLFLGPTGVGKTELAKSIAAIYFGNEDNLIRLDMSEYQQVADVNRILESAATNQDAFLPKVRQSPFSVVLFDEIEKAHSGILNLFLQLLDEGALTDTEGKQVSFRDTIIIATSNAGADEIRQRIEAGQQLESFESEFVDKLISAGAFKPELLNRFDEIVLFKPLGDTELSEVVKLLIAEVNRNLEPKKISVQLTPNAVADLVKTGHDPRLGARPMRRMVQRRVEDQIASQILAGSAKPGDTVTIDVSQLGPGQDTTPKSA